MLRKQFIFPLVYFLIVLMCILVAFDFDGSLRSFAAWSVAVVLTLPWSIVSILFLWAIIHGAGLEFFTFIYLFFALLNGLIIYRILRPKKASDQTVELP